MSRVFDSSPAVLTGGQWRTVGRVQRWVPHPPPAPRRPHARKIPMTPKGT